MTFLPVSLNITGKKILFVGGGKVASHKLKALEQFDPDIDILSIEFSDVILNNKYKKIPKKYDSLDLKGYHLVYACTNDEKTNRMIKEDADKWGLLVNVADNPSLCDFISPAILKKEEITIAVGSNARNVKKAIALRDKIASLLKDDL